MVFLWTDKIKKLCKAEKNLLRAAQFNKAASYLESLQKKEEQLKMKQ